MQSPRSTRLREAPWTLAVIVIGAWLGNGTPTVAHSAWPDLYSARLWVGCAEGGGADEEPGVCRLDLVATLEVPVAEVILAFREAHAELDWAAAVRSGEIDELEEAFRSSQFERLGGSLTVRRAGEEVGGIWRPTERLGNGYGIEGFFSYELRFEPELSQTLLLVGRLALSISNSNFERAAVMYANLIDPGRSLHVVETSTPQPSPGVDLMAGSAEEMALWSADEQRRVFHLVVEPAAAAGDASP